VAFHELEEIVAQLEQGDLPLEQALELHERGQKLAAYCAGQLDQAELRVKKLEINQE
jgi:exodeoxyribonuclease VII small subunit